MGYYLTQLHNYILTHGSATGFSLNNTVNHMLASSLAVDNPLRTDLTPYLFFGHQRGLLIEDKLNDTLLATPQGGLLLGNIFVPAGSSQPVQLPYWAINTTIYQNAAIFPFTPDVLKKYQVTGFFHDNNLYRGTNDEIDLYHVPVSIGLTASASVPFAIPATTLVSDGCENQKECYLQLLDGGLADNLGIYTALEFLLQDKSKIKILIVVDAYKGSATPYSQSMNPPEKIPLLWRVVTASMDSNHEHLTSNVNDIAHDVLCRGGASHVIVVYLDIKNYPVAQSIGTQLNVSLENQMTLLDIGEQLVVQDKTLTAFLRQLDQQQLTMGQCK